MTIVNTVHHKGCSFSIPECVATILFRRVSGALGEYVPLVPEECGLNPDNQDHARVTAGGRTFIAWREPNGGPWHVSFKGYEGIDVDPEEATRLTLSGSDSRDVSRNYPIHGAA